MNSLRNILVCVSTLSLLVGCGDSSPAADASVDRAGDASVDAPAADAPAADAPAADAPAADAPAADAPAADGSTGNGLRFLARFNLMQGQLPEGIAIRDGYAYLGFAPTGQVMRVDAMGNATMYGQVPIPPSMTAMPNGYLLGLAFDRAGNLYAAAPSFSMGFMAGVYRMGPMGGMATLFARDTMGRMNFPNGIDFDAMGNLFVTDSGSGSVFKISPDGMTVSQWVTNMLLTGIPGGNPCGPGAGFPIGANGIVVDAMGGNVYVTNTDRATLVRIPITMTGAAGTPTVIVAQDCQRLAGADGLTRGPDGALYIAANSANRIVRVGIDGMNPTVLEMSPLLDSPASIAFGPLSGASTMFITNAAFNTAQSMPAMARPGLLVRPAM